jgi:hypothetical protein
VFEPDQFELADGRLELSGRWYGVQGRRFMRPSLTFRHRDGETRLLADLEHKPWAAVNGERWLAAFPCDGELDAAADAELTVAPDLTVELPVPKGLRARRQVRKRRGDNDRDSARRKETVRAKVASNAGDGNQPPTRAKVGPVRQAVASDREEAVQTQALSAARAEIATLRERLDQASRELADQRSRFARELGEARAVTAEALRTRDQAIAGGRKAIEDRQMAEKTMEEAMAARGKARKAGERALTRGKEALSARDEAVAERDQALKQRAHALKQRNRAVAQRDDALAQREQALRKRDQALSDLNGVRVERDELATAHEQLRVNHESAVTTRGAPLAMRNDAIEPGPRHQAQWITVAMAVVSLLAVILAVALILGSN